MSRTLGTLLLTLVLPATSVIGCTLIAEVDRTDIEERDGNSDDAPEIGDGGAENGGADGGAAGGAG